MLVIKNYHSGFLIIYSLFLIQSLALSTLLFVGRLRSSFMIMSRVLIKSSVRVTASELSGFS